MLFFIKDSDEEAGEETFVPNQTKPHTNIRQVWGDYIFLLFPPLDLSPF